MTNEPDRISFDDLVSAIEAKLTAAGASSAVARVVATNCATCERDALSATESSGSPATSIH
ncbi:hypothetical protein [Brevibacterium sp. JSBI002]|uniref:hypothetical protein n=1 Tax=Brevibacterium sp. JSBI002 TaxID=2886045 RepID=UPI00222F81A8|nr:hypothetical protein [Brevibacterium sp. JSBI002]UZD63991.1 hypothetical protein LJ362_14705 [Brevibacterium sp. JSBI002]